MNQESGFVCIKDIRHGSKNINVMFIILEIGKNNIIVSILLAKNNTVFSGLKMFEKS